MAFILENFKNRAAAMAGDLKDQAAAVAGVPRAMIGRLGHSDTHGYRPDETRFSDMGSDINKLFDKFDTWCNSRDRGQFSLTGHEAELMNTFTQTSRSIYLIGGPGALAKDPNNLTNSDKIIQEQASTLQALGSCAGIIFRCTRDTPEGRANVRKEFLQAKQGYKDQVRRVTDGISALEGRKIRTALTAVRRSLALRALRSTITASQNKLKDFGLSSETGAQIRTPDNRRQLLAQLNSLDGTLKIGAGGQPTGSNQKQANALMGVIHALNKGGLENLFDNDAADSNKLTQHAGTIHTILHSTVFEEWQKAGKSKESEQGILKNNDFKKRLLLLLGDIQNDANGSILKNDAIVGKLSRASGQEKQSMEQFIREENAKGKSTCVYKCKMTSSGGTMASGYYGGGEQKNFASKDQELDLSMDEILALFEKFISEQPANVRGEYSVRWPWTSNKYCFLVFPNPKEQDNFFAYAKAHELQSKQTKADVEKVNSAVKAEAEAKKEKEPRKVLAIIREHNNDPSRQKKYEEDKKNFDEARSKSADRRDAEPIPVKVGVECAAELISLAITKLIGETYPHGVQIRSAAASENAGAEAEPKAEAEAGTDAEAKAKAKAKAKAEAEATTEEHIAKILYQSGLDTSNPTPPLQKLIAALKDSPPPAPGQDKNIIQYVKDALRADNKMLDEITDHSMKNHEKFITRVDNKIDAIQKLQKELSDVAGPKGKEEACTKLRKLGALAAMKEELEDILSKITTAIHTIKADDVKNPELLKALEEKKETLVEVIQAAEEKLGSSKSGKADLVEVIQTADDELTKEAAEMENIKDPAEAAAERKAQLKAAREEAAATARNTLKEARRNATPAALAAAQAARNNADGLELQQIPKP